MFDSLQYRILKSLSQGGRNLEAGADYTGASKLHRLFGEKFLARLAGKTVIDFGAGQGFEAVAIAQAGASRVIGLELRPELFEAANENARRAGVADRCLFTTQTSERADIIVSLDSFEHFDDPAAILALMHGLLRPGGELLASFGPTWYHPYGGHLFSIFPFAHLLFSEAALLRWRSDFKHDGATRFAEVSGGLNQITIARFEKIVAASPFQLIELEAVPIGKIAPLHNGLTREFTTALVRARLTPRK